jgi:hypothetical protein
MTRLARYSVILFLLLFWTSVGTSVEARTQCDPQRDLGPFVPVVYARKGDRLPQAVTAVGTVTAITQATYCGTIHWAGTVRLDLLEPIPGYPHRQFYLAISCLSPQDNYLGKRMRVTAEKLAYDKTNCRYGCIQNRIDSLGVPFYRMTRLIEIGDPEPAPLRVPN